MLGRGGDGGGGLNTEDGLISFTEKGRYVASFTKQEDPSIEK